MQTVENTKLQNNSQKRKMKSEIIHDNRHCVTIYANSDSDEHFCDSLLKSKRSVCRMRDRKDTVELKIIS